VTRIFREKFFILKYNVNIDAEIYDIEGAILHDNYPDMSDYELWDTSLFDSRDERLLSSLLGYHYAKDAGDRNNYELIIVKPYIFDLLTKENLIRERNYQCEMYVGTYENQLHDVSKLSNHRANYNNHDISVYIKYNFSFPIEGGFKTDDENTRTKVYFHPNGSIKFKELTSISDDGSIYYTKYEKDTHGEYDGTYISFFYSTLSPGEVKSAIFEHGKQVISSQSGDDAAE